MLREFYVENFGLIENIQVDLSQGLNVLTGETGAGKSLIIDAVGLLIGGRGSQDFIRTGAEKLFVQGVFSGELSQELILLLSEAGMDLEDDTLILNRELFRTGKNVCRINYRTVPLSLFKEVGKRLINIHGQHEHINLLEESHQLSLLDNYGGQALFLLKEKVKESFLNIKNLKNQLTYLEENTRDAVKKQDFLTFQIKEIEEANLKVHEDEALEKQRKFLQNAEKLALDSRTAYEKLYGSRQAGACDLIGDTLRCLKEIANFDEKIEQIYQNLNELNYTLEDIVRALGNYCENITNNPEELDEIEHRLILLNKLKKKYGPTIEEILKYYREAKEELAVMDVQEEKHRKLTDLLKKEEQKYHLISAELSKLRQQAAERLSDEVTGELKQLHMPSAKFHVQIEEILPGLTGKDGVKFLISPNPGEELKPVVRIASGGELSRIMLGLKVVLSQTDEIPTLIFDEIDSGLGGKAVSDVAQKMKIISQYCQIICVTHSPIIAGFANQHLKISKDMLEKRTVTKIETLHDQNILIELSRMLAGDNVSEITIPQARELLKIGRK